MAINLRSPTTQKWVIGMTVVFGMVYGYVNFVYLPRREQAKKSAGDVQRETDLLNRGKRIAANFKTVQDDHARLMQSWDIAHDLLPTQREIEGLLKNITLEGQQRDVSFMLFKPLDPVEQPYYWENPIQIKTLSSYHDLGDFLSAVAAMDRIVNINRIRLTNHASNKRAANQTVEAEFIASIYIFKELGSPVTTAAAENIAKKGGAAKNESSDETVKPARPPAAKDKGQKT
jgi:type IV pilus assembly protein PilO